MTQDTGDPIVPPGTRGTEAFFGLSEGVAAVRSQHSGPDAPVPPLRQPGLFWLKDDSGVLSIRNLSDTAWTELFDLKGRVNFDLFPGVRPGAVPASLKVNGPVGAFEFAVGEEVVCTLPIVGNIQGDIGIRGTFYPTGSEVGKDTTWTLSVAAQQSGQTVTTLAGSEIAADVALPSSQDLPFQVFWTLDAATYFPAPEDVLYFNLLLQRSPSSNDPTAKVALLGLEAARPTLTP